MNLYIVPPMEPEPEPDDTSGSFERLGNLIPQWMLLKRPELAHINSHEKLAQIEARMRAEAREETRRYMAARNAGKCYTWLGPDNEEPGLEEKTFDTFDKSREPKAFQVTWLYVTEFDRSGPNILMQGDYGTGKTHLAAAILNVLRERGIPCLFATAQNLLNALYAASFDEKQHILQQAGMTALLVLDDLDKLYVKQDGAYQKDTLFDILDRRYKRQLPTILTTNAQKDLGQWLNAATLDRLYEHCILLSMQGKSYRRMLAERNSK